MSCSHDARIHPCLEEKVRDKRGLSEINDSAAEHTLVLVRALSWSTKKWISRSANQLDRLSGVGSIRSRTSFMLGVLRTGSERLADFLNQRFRVRLDNKSVTINFQLNCFRC